MDEPLVGIGAAPGRAVGQALLISPAPLEPRAAAPNGSDRATELARFEWAVEVLNQRLSSSREALHGAPEQSPSAVADALLRSQEALLMDPLLVDGVRQRINLDGMPAEHAVEVAVASLAERLLDVADPHFGRLGEDLDGVSQALLALLADPQASTHTSCRPGAIVIAHTLTVSETLALLEAGAAGFILTGSSKTSHVAVLCRSAGKPAVVRMPGAFRQFASGDWVELDGDTGRLARASAGQTTSPRGDHVALEWPPCLAPDGTPVTLRANLDIRLDAEWARAQGTDGVGLWRTFFQFVGRDELPPWAQLHEAYARVVKAFAPAPVTIRLLDLSGPFHDQELPTALRGLGPCRGIGLRHHAPEVLESQIDAIVAAGRDGNLRLLVPYVSDPREVVWVRARVEQARRRYEVAAEVPVGAMIEVPSALNRLDALCEVSDFLTIGSNDLESLLLGVTREQVPTHTSPSPALLQAIEDVVRAGRRLGKRVCLCGEVAADPKAARLLMEAGLRELSVSPSLAPSLRITLDDLYRRGAIGRQRALDAAERVTS